MKTTPTTYTPSHKISKNNIKTIIVLPAISTTTTLLMPGTFKKIKLKVKWAKNFFFLKRANIVDKIYLKKAFSTDSPVAFKVAVENWAKPI